MDPLGSLIDWIAVYGVLGLFAIGLAECFVPALPFYGVLVAISIAAVDGAWSVPVAVIATTAGSFSGGLPFTCSYEPWGRIGPPGSCIGLAGCWAYHQRASIERYHRSGRASEP